MLTPSGMDTRIRPYTHTNLPPYGYTRMQVVSVINQKGGVGKTTIATALAVAAVADGKQTALFDLDPQANASFWSDIRQAETPLVRDIQPVRLSHYLEIMSEAGCDLVVIDCPAIARDVALQAADPADFVLVPSRAGVFDIASMRTTLSLLQSFEKRASVVLTFCPPSGPEVPAAVEGIAQIGATLCPVRIGDRKAYARAQQQGLTAQEAEPQSKAAQEIEALYLYTRSQLETTDARE